MSKIYEFVLTGGPCSGKTSCLSRLDNELGQKGYKVIVVPETATEVINSGINPIELSETDFQKVIINRCINKEETVRYIATKYNKDVVVIYDRGLLDSKAYMSYENFEKILKEKGHNEIELRDNYDAVFHLVTAAIGKEEAYTLANNTARRETLEEARKKDISVLKAWIGHPHLRVIDNSTEFDEKINRLLKEVYTVLGIPTPLEIERKFLIKKPDISSLLEKGSVKSSIVQTYLKRKDPNVERRVRQRGTNGIFSYYYTEKVSITDKKRQEVESKISKDEYISYLTEAEKILRKDRYCFMYNNQYFELDIYPDMEDKAILEIELTSENQKVELPDFIQVIKEVTGMKKYSNYNLAK